MIIAMLRRLHHSSLAVLAACSVCCLLAMGPANAQTAAPSISGGGSIAATSVASTAAPTLSAAPAPAIAATPESSQTIQVASPAASASSAIQPSSLAAGPPLSRTQIFDFLGRVIRWHGSLTDELRLSDEPEETLYVADERQTADQVLKLAFDFAHAAAALIEGQSPPHPAAGASTKGEDKPAEVAGAASESPVIEELQTRRNQVLAGIDQLKQQLADLRAQSARAASRQRGPLSREIITTQARIDLAESRLDSIDTMINFESGTLAPDGSSSGLDTQIDALEHSTPSLGSPAAALQATPPPASTQYTGLLGGAENLLRINRKQRTLDHVAVLTRDLRQTVVAARHALSDQLTELDREGLSQTVHASDQDPLALKQTKADFDDLTRRGKLLSAAILPLAKQAVLLDLYVTSLEQWNQAVRHQFNQALRGMLFRLGSLAAMLLAVFIAAAVWRRLAFRYVKDFQRRAQLLRLRRFIVIAALGLILVLGFANQLSALATVLGFAAAGIALALQNVILSLAGYFYLSGRFGVRVGDRVQVSGITGDVLENGFFRLSLMELSGDESGQQPTGRVVIFPNSVIFQANSNFFRQLPGTSFSWQELNLSLAPDCDYRLAEQRLTEVANEVFARDRDRIQGEYRTMENELAIRIDTPRPQVRLRLGPAGLEMVIRYPARLKDAVRTADEISRRLVDTIRREPGLRIGVVGTPIIQSDPTPPPPEQPPESPSTKDSTPSTR